MIRLVAPTPALDAAAVHALETLADLARLPWVDDPDANVVELHILDAVGADPVLRQVASAPDESYDVRDGQVLVDRRLLALVARVAFAIDEQRSTAGDKYDRIPATENALVPQGLDRVPVVSSLAAALVRAVVRAAGRRPVRLVEPWPHGHRWAASITHDLDVVALWPLFSLLRVAELGRAGELRQAGEVLAAAAASLHRSPVWAGVRQLLDMEAAVGARSTWFILSGTPTLGTVRRGDLTYRPESSLARRILAAITAGGHEVGLHGSFATMRDADCMTRQRLRLREVVGQEVLGVRQHFLRLRPGATPRVMRDAGFEYDASLGYHDRNGFRLGVADAVTGWDDAGDHTLPLWQAPLTWMDRAMSKYQGNQQPGDWTAEGLALAGRCRAEQGLWVGLWHPNLVPALGYPGAPAAFERLLRTLAESEAWLAPLGDIVRWRARRRAVRVTLVADDGRQQLGEAAIADGGGAATPRLEDATRS